jgi:hypothetical protein
MDMTLTGAGAQSNIEAQIDPSHNALRVQARPNEHVGVAGLIGGHYAVSVYSGTIAASLTANSVLFSMRWADATKVMVLKRLFAWMALTGAPGAATGFPLEAIRATSFTASFSANNTNTTPATSSQKMRTSNMAGSVFSTAGAIQICTTAGMTGMTYTLDTAGFASNTLQGTAATGAGGSLPLYDENEFGQHPLVLSTNEGFVIRNPIAYPGTTTVQLGVVAWWLETAAY